MTRRRGRDVSERKSGMGEDERQPVMARLAARRRCFNLVSLVTLRKGNHPREAYVRRGQKKSFMQKRKGLLREPHEEVDIQRKALRRRKNLAFSEDTCFEKKRMRSKVTPRKVGVGLKRRLELSKRKLGWRLAWWGSTEKNEASHFLKLRERHQYSDQRSNRNRAPCVASTAVGTESKEDQMARLSA